MAVARPSSTASSTPERTRQTGEPAPAYGLSSTLRRHDGHRCRRLCGLQSQPRDVVPGGLPGQAGHARPAEGPRGRAPDVAQVVALPPDRAVLPARAPKACRAGGPGRLGQCGAGRSPPGAGAGVPRPGPASRRCAATRRRARGFHLSQRRLPMRSRGGAPSVGSSSRAFVLATPANAPHVLDRPQPLEQPAWQAVQDGAPVRPPVRPLS